LWTVVFLGLLAAVTYFSLRSSPAMATVPLFPGWWGRWLDGHDTLKNGLGFGALALAGLMAVRPRCVRRRAHGAGRGAEGWMLGFLALLILGLELAQLGLEKRQADWRDVVAGWLALVVVFGALRLTQPRQAHAGVNSTVRKPHAEPQNRGGEGRELA
jgi:hypothetical protein